MANVVPVKSEQHKNIKIASKRDLSHVADQHIAPITAVEFSQAATSYPIMLVKEPESGRFRSVVMLGLESGQNLYHSDDKWDAIYVPQSLSNVPFSLGLDPEKENTLTACVDLDSPFVGEDKENALFDDEGKDTEFYKKIQESLGRMYENEVTTERFIKELHDKGLLIELELTVNYTSGQKPRKLVGLYGIDDKKLAELDDETIIDFHKRGLFIPIHALLGSVGQVNRLAQLFNKTGGETGIVGINVAPAQKAE